MPSNAYRRWAATRKKALDEITQAHAAVGGTKRGRRHATQQINHAYALLLASQFQGFCRDLHSECVDHLVATIAPPPSLVAIVRRQFSEARQLDRGNAQPGSIGADFDRLGIRLWYEAGRHDPDAGAWRVLLEELNTWRNAIAHQDFNPPSIAGRTSLQLKRVKQWRSACDRLARAFDKMMRRHLEALTGTSPW